VIPVGEKAVVGDLHRDRAEALSNSAGLDVPDEGAAESMPIDSVVLSKTLVFGGDESRLDEGWDIGKLNVDASDHGKASNETAIAVENPSALVWMECLYRGGGRTAGKPTGVEPEIEIPHGANREPERDELLPVAPDPMPGAAGIIPHASQQAEQPFAAPGRISIRCMGLEAKHASGTLLALAGFLPLGIHRMNPANNTSRWITALSVTAALAACGHSSPAPADSAAGTVATDSAGGEIAAQSDTGHRPPNRMGRIPVLEYHVIGDSESQFRITADHFRRDLQLLYGRGYRPITISQLLDKDFSAVPVGMSPVVFVFDDASPGQFSYIERNGQLEIDPTSAVGIWQDFASRHPDWKGKAVFCLLNGGEAGHNFFGDKPKYHGQKNEWRFRKVKWLADNGFELCDHTLWHARLSEYSDPVVQEQIARNVMGIDSAVAGYKIRTMALPLGLWPKNRSLAWQGSWNNPATGTTTSYHFDAVLEVAGGPARSPYDPKFDPHSIPRVEAFGTQLAQALDRLDKTKTRFVR
jgi:hypothetical protein